MPVVCSKDLLEKLENMAQPLQSCQKEKKWHNSGKRGLRLVESFHTRGSKSTRDTATFRIFGGVDTSPHLPHHKLHPLYIFRP